MNPLRSFILLILLCTSISTVLEATHLRAGEITAKRISNTSLTYRFKLVIYSDTESGVPVGSGGGGGIFDFGDGRRIVGQAFLTSTSIIGRQETQLGNFTSVVVYEFEHTFQNFGNYIISYTEGNRNENIINLGGIRSGEFPFHVETFLRLAPGFENSTPELLVPPLDQACVGLSYLHNPGAFDIDGDSLAYRLVNPRSGRGIDINEYLPLNDPTVSDIRDDQGSPSIFKMDSISGTLTWNAPQFTGEYSIAFVIEEWRYSEEREAHILVGYVTRDMQVTAEDCESIRPVLEVPPDICVEAGTLILEETLATMPDGSELTTEAFGGPFEQASSPARYLNLPDTNIVSTLRESPARNLFFWQTDLSHVQSRPYEVIFKATGAQVDRSLPVLLDIGTMKIQVKAPAPTGLEARIESRSSIELNWDNYVGAAYFPTMKVYRRIDSFEFDFDKCLSGLPPNSGYELLDELPINQTTFLDDDNVRTGVRYCYRVVAEFPQPRGGTSYASTEICIAIPSDAPLVTNVSVEHTDVANGEIFVKWTSPLDVNPMLFPPPYRYELVRYRGLSGDTDRTLVTSTFDTTFTDTGLNTRDEAFNYSVLFYDRDDNLVDSSANASSVRLETTPEIRSAMVNWEAEVPWSNQIQSSPYHLIYRNRTDNLANDDQNYMLIDSIQVFQGGFSYFDEGQYNGIGLLSDRAYCYFVRTAGGYGNDKVPETLFNLSQIGCVTPLPQLEPTPPIIDLVRDTTLVAGPEGQELVTMQTEACEVKTFETCGINEFSNTITWTIDDISQEVVSYNIFFSKTGGDGTYRLIGTSTEKTFTHSGLTELSGCYQVSAVNISNIEGEKSSPVCFDNCPYYELPNTFTPNNDGINDTFRAFDYQSERCSRFVKSVIFRVYDRWGGNELFTYNSVLASEVNHFIDWEGRDNKGVDLPSGTYYYECQVIFSTLSGDEQTQQMKNWVQLVR